MKIKRDFIIAWSLLHVLDRDEYQKMEYYRYELNEKYRLKVGIDILKKISATLNNFELIDTLSGVGTKWNRQLNLISMKEVLKALYSIPKYDTMSPSGRAIGELVNSTENIYVRKYVK
jgi:hypothetical protein